MDKENIKLTTFDTKPQKVMCAEYKDSIYFILNGKCINDAVRRYHGELDNVDIHVMQSVLNIHLEENPEDDLVYIPLYRLILIDDPKTTVDFVQGFCRDLLGFSRRRCMEVVNELNSDKAESDVGSYTYEIVNTLSRFLDNGNYQFEQNLGHRIEEVTQDQKITFDTNVALQQLIERDYPEDL